MNVSRGECKMIRHAFNVADTYEISGRGLVVIVDIECGELPNWLALKCGDPIEFRGDSIPIIRTYVAGIEMLDPWKAERPFGFLLPAEVSKSQVPIESAVWVTQESIVNSSRPTE